MCEVNLDYIELDAFERRDYFAAPQMPSSNLHEGIVYPKNDFLPMTRTVTLVTERSGSDIKAQKVLQGSIAPMGSTSAEGGFTITWGGENGTEVSGYISGSASDNSGNTAEVTVEVNSDGSGSADVSVKHEE